MQILAGIALGFAAVGVLFLALAAGAWKNGRRASSGPPRLPAIDEQMAVLTVLPLGHLEEPAHAFERRPRLVPHTRVQSLVHAIHVETDHLKREVFLAPEMVVERSLRHPGLLEEVLDAEVVVAVLEQRGRAAAAWWGVIGGSLRA